MTDPTPTDATDGFADRVQQLHVPEPKADREALLLKLGAAMAVVGVVLIFVAWFQTSGTDSVAEQIPFAISGGLVGLALVIFGSALVIRYSLARLFRFWLARMLYEHQVQTDRTVEALGRIEAVLGGQPPGAPADHSGARPTASTDSVTAADA